MGTEPQFIILIRSEHFASFKQNKRLGSRMSCHVSVRWLYRALVLCETRQTVPRLYMLYAFLSFNRVLYLPVVSNHGFLVVDPARLHNSNGCIGRIPLHENRNARNSTHRLVGKTQCLKSSARQKKDIKCLIHFSSPVQTAI